MNEFIAKIADEALVGVILFVLAFFARKLLFILWEKLLHNSFEKHIYKEAARNEPQKNVDAISERFFLGLSICILIVGISQVNRVSNLDEEAIVMEKVVIRDNGFKDCKGCSPVKAMKQTKEIQFEVFKLKFSCWLFIIVSSFVMLRSFNRIVRRYFTYDMQIKFQQDLNKIRPYIEEMEFHQLNSSWAYMENAQDYKAIQDRIKNIEAILIKNKRNI